VDIYCERTTSSHINELRAIGFTVVREDHVRYFVRPTKDALFWRKVKCKDYVKILEEKEALRRAVEEYRREKRRKRKQAQVELERYFEEKIEEEVEEIVKKIQIEVVPSKEWAREVGKVIAEEIVKALRAYLAKK